MAESFPHGNYFFSRQVLERYNDLTRRVAREASILLINLAHEMPKDSVHYTNAGAEFVADAIAQRFIPRVKQESRVLAQ